MDINKKEYKKGKLPHPICCHSSIIIKENIYIYGGTDGVSFLSTLYKLNLQEMKIYKYKNEKEINHPASIATNITYLSKSNELILFAGSSIHQESG